MAFNPIFENIKLGNNSDDTLLMNTGDVQGVQAILRVAPGKNAFHGWKFFKVSYTFLGSVRNIKLNHLPSLLS